MDGLGGGMMIGDDEGESRTREDKNQLTREVMCLLPAARGGGS